jgi:hypothetical protein
MEQCFDDVCTMKTAQKGWQRILTSEAKYSEIEITTYCHMKARRIFPLLCCGIANTRWGHQIRGRCRAEAGRQHVTLCFLCGPTRGYVTRNSGHQLPVIQCGGWFKYLCRSPASRRSRRKGNPVPEGITGLPRSWGIV